MPYALEEGTETVCQALPTIKFNLAALGAKIQINYRLRKVAAVKTPRAGPRHGAETFNLERASPGLHKEVHEGFSGFLRFYKAFPMLNLEPPWRVAKGAVSAATYRTDPGSGPEPAQDPRPPEENGNPDPPSGPPGEGGAKNKKRFKHSLVNDDTNLKVGNII